jgi:hypothetical protein
MVVPVKSGGPRCVFGEHRLCWEQQQPIFKVKVRCMSRNNGRKPGAGRQWLKPIILATKKSEIRRVMVHSQPGQIVQ